MTGSKIKFYNPVTKKFNLILNFIFFIFNLTNPCTNTELSFQWKKVLGRVSNNILCIFFKNVKMCFIIFVFFSFNHTLKWLWLFRTSNCSSNLYQLPFLQGLTAINFSKLGLLHPSSVSFPLYLKRFFYWSATRGVAILNCLNQYN